MLRDEAIRRPPAHGHPDQCEAAAAAPDSERADNLIGDGIAVDIARAERGHQLRFTLFAGRSVPLRRVLPAIQGMDLEVLNEDTTTITRTDGTHCYRYDFAVQAGSDAAAGIERLDSDTTGGIVDTFHSIWSGLSEADGFNALVPAVGLSWQQVSVLRSYARYFRQSLLPYSQTRIQRVLLDHPHATRAIISSFEARFAEPIRPVHDSRRIATMTATQAELDDQIERVVTIDADRILRAYRSIIGATVRTNSFAPEALTASVPYLAHKICARNFEELPEPRPSAEIFVCSPAVEGVHLRFGLVARGGLRWSDRLDDYRTEVLGLVKAQAVKNAVIVPAGAKGAFVVKQAPPSSGTGAADHAATREHGLDCYRQFVSGLIDLTDNYSAGATTPQAPVGVVCHDGADPYLVVAADKGTASFSDAANAVALQHDYWLGDAFASGGSDGYDHKAMGITARGAWVSADSHLRELGIDSETDEFTVIGIGDMSGDVFGNGLLLRRGIRLVGAFDHRHVFVDPTPATEPAHRERRRLFELPHSSWDDYDRTLISEGGGVWARTAKTIPVSTQLRAALGIADPVTELSPVQLIRHLLCAPTDLLWNGGVGTYVKGSDEPHSEVGDKVNDPLRITASELRAKAVVEAGNLGVSPRGRIEFARRGGLINTDAIDNAAGVDCSDHEVNIKILLDSAIETHTVDRRRRNELLADSTDEVAQLVLANNRAHNRLLGDARFNARRMVDVHARLTTSLEHRRGLHRERELLPSASQYAELAGAGQGLSTPQLATLMAHVKLDLKADLLDGDLLDDPYLSSVLENYFPSTLRERLGAPITQHRLRREIIATSIVNNVLATSGITYAFRLTDETGATTSDVVRAHTMASRVFDLDTLWEAIRSAGLPPDLTNTLVIEGRRLLDRASRWFLLNRPQPLDIAGEIARFRQPIAALNGQVATMLRGAERAAVDHARQGLLDQGVHAGVARRISESLYAFSLLDIVEVANAHRQDPVRLAHAYFELSDHLDVDKLLLAVSSLPRAGRWQALARLALREDLYRSLRTLALDVVECHTGPGSATAGIQQWEQVNRPLLDRAHRTLAEFPSAGSADLAAVSVASSQIRRLTPTHR
jgi:glutamate dehydrogenase